MIWTLLSSIFLLTFTCFRISVHYSVNTVNSLPVSLSPKGHKSLFFKYIVICYPVFQAIYRVSAPPFLNCYIVQIHQGICLYCYITTSTKTPGQGVQSVSPTFICDSAQWCHFSLDSNCQKCLHFTLELYILLFSELTEKFQEKGHPAVVFF